MNLYLHAVQEFGGIFGGLAALAWVGRRLVLLDHAITKLHALTNAELSHNGGHSTKDYAAKGYRKARKVERQVKHLEARLDGHLAAHAQPVTVTTTTGATDA